MSNIIKCCISVELGKDTYEPSAKPKVIFTTSGCGYDDGTKFVVCEKSLKPDEFEPQAIKLPVIDLTTFNIFQNFTTCSSGVLTLNYMACDARSKCFRNIGKKFISISLL